MKTPTQPSTPHSAGERSASMDALKPYFLDILRQMYWAESEIGRRFTKIKDDVGCAQLKESFANHCTVHIRHQKRLKKIFDLLNEEAGGSKNKVVQELLAETQQHLTQLAANIINWETALILTSQKLTHYKIANYSGLTHLALTLKYYPAATLLAFCVQDEEDYSTGDLTKLLGQMLVSYAADYNQRLE